MMLSVGLELQGKHFQQLTRRKALLLFALAGQMVILPAVGLLITRLLSLPTHVALGILLLAACPVGDIANFYTLLARGNVALSVAVNALSCLLSFATMAVVFEIYGRLSGGIFSFSVPSFALVVRLLLLVAAPILAGMGLRLMRPRLAERAAWGLRIGCVIGVLALCGFVVATQREQLAADWRLRP
jgi:BASS family bile acid:Na+ symporter